MKGREKFSWRKRALSFRYAWQGLASLLRYEHNARIHAVCAAAVFVAGILFRISAVEWALISVCIGMVIAAECLNSAVEALADKVSPDKDPLIKRAKDLAAAAVLLLAMASVAVAAFIFIPKF